MKDSCQAGRYRFLLAGVFLLSVAICWIWQIGGCTQVTDQKALPSKQPVEITVLFTSDTLGRFEDCACPKKPTGGMPRRATGLRKYGGDEYLLVDAGNTNSPTRSFILLGWQYELKMMGMMNYDVANMGRTELQVRKENLLKIAGESAVPLISANVIDNDTSQLLLTSYLIVKRFGRRIAVTGVVYDGYDNMDMAEGLKVLPAGGALDDVLKELRGKYDMLVVLADMPLEQAKVLAEDFPQISLMIITQQKSNKKDPVMHGQACIVQGGHGDYRLAKLVGTLQDSKLTDANVREFKLGRKTPKDAELLKMIEEYNAALNAKMSKIKGGDKLKRWYDLLNKKGVKNWYVGAQWCASCHREDYDIWSRTGHAHAYSTLVDNKRHGNPECLQCHTVGFNEVSGFKLDEPSDYLRGVQCGNCHGEGANHRMTQSGLRPYAKPKPMKVGSREAQIKLCKTCHDPVKSPDFEFDRHWPMIKHGHEAKLPPKLEAKLKESKKSQSRPASGPTNTAPASSKAR